MSKKKPKTEKQKLKECADASFSNFIRERDKFTCYTCGKKGDKKNIDCGHYKKRSHMNTRYDEENCRAQCKGCNIFLNGNYTVFAWKLVNDFGPKILDDLEKKSKITKKYTTQELKEISEKYINKLNELKK